MAELMNFLKTVCGPDEGDFVGAIDSVLTNSSPFSYLYLSHSLNKPLSERASLGNVFVLFFGMHCFKR
jgi:hypothetical protein